MTERELIERTKQFALRAIKLIGALPQTIQGRVIASLGVVEEEADESAFWLELIGDAGLLNGTKVEPLRKEASEIVPIMASSKKTASRSAWESQIANRNTKV